MERKLAAILAADVVGYSRLVATDEEETLASLATCRMTIAGLIAEHGGRIFGTAGDSIIAEFSSAVQAVRAAVAIQRAINRRNADLVPKRRMVFRIGLHLGDVVIDGTDLLGDGVNIAARLESIAEPGGIALSDAIREQVLGRIDTDLRYSGRHALKNIDRTIEVWRWEPTETATLPATISGSETLLPLPDKPSLAVLPFDNMSGDPSQAYFADGFVEDIIVELSRFRSLFVIARNSSFAFRGERLGIQEIARRLGVRYVVEGSVRRIGNRIRIAAQLIEAKTGAHLWAERYDRAMDDIFEVQDEVVRTVVATVAGRLELAGAEMAKRKPPESLAAYDYVMRGLEQLNQEGEAHNAAARIMFEKAVERDPDYAAGHAYLALGIYMQWVTSRASGELDRALASARQAVALDDNDSRCHRILSLVYTQLRQHDRAVLHSDRSIALNPNDALAAIYRAGLLRYLGRAGEGVEWARLAMRINPYHPNWYWNSLANVLLSAGRYEEALDAYGQMAERPSYYHAHVAACHAELGQMDDARRHAALALQTRPDFSVAAWGARLPYKNDVDLQHFLHGMRKAGLPD